MPRSFLPRFLPVIVAILLCFLLPASALAEVRFIFADGSTASAPVKNCDLQRIELSMGDPNMPGQGQINVVTTAGRVHRLSLGDGQAASLLRVEFSDDNYQPPPPVPTPPSPGPGDSGSLGCGSESFADRVLAFTPGNPAPTRDYMQGHRAVGPPDGLALALGCGGELILAWDGVYLMDVPGPDLVLHTAAATPYEQQEYVRVALRLDSNGQWDDCGVLQEGGELDISACAAPGMRYNQIRLRDSGEGCRGAAPGSDVDSVEFLGCVGN